MQSRVPEADASGPSRRAFLATAASVAALAGSAPAAAEPPAVPGLATRPFGKTGVSVPLLGLGCFPVGSVPDTDAAVALVRRALEQGCRYLDTAPSYSAGKSESRVGQALKTWPRADVFVATKTHTRTADEARRDLEGSLERLGLSTIDLIQVHAVSDEADLVRALAKDGPLAALVKARDEGLVRFIGVTGHADPAVMRATFERWPFDAVLFPLNCVDPHHMPFVEGTLPAAVEKGLARIAMKVFASGNLPRKGIDPERCLRWVYGHDITTAIVGCASAEELDLALRVARDPRPLSAEEAAELLRGTLPHRGRGVEWYKRA